jgi:hypothetical protein
MRKSRGKRKRRKKMQQIEKGANKNAHRKLREPSRYE